MTVSENSIRHWKPVPGAVESKELGMRPDGGQLLFRSWKDDPLICH